MTAVNLSTIVNSKQIFIDLNLLEANALSSIHKKTNRLGYYILNSEYHVTTEQKAKEKKVSLQTDLVKLSKLFTTNSPTSALFTGEKELEGDFNLSHAIAAAKLFNFIHQKILKRNENIETFSNKGFVSFLLKVPVINYFVRSYFHKAEPIDEMVQKSITAFFIKGKTQVATSAEKQEIKTLITPRQENGQKPWSNIYKVFTAFQAILPFINDTNSLKESFNTDNTFENAQRKFFDLNKLIHTAKDNQRIVLENFLKINYVLDEITWNTLIKNVEIVYLDRLRQIFPCLKKAQDILKGELNQVKVDGQPYEHWVDMRDKLLTELSMNASVETTLPLALQDELRKARSAVQEAHGLWQATRILNLEDKINSSSIFGSKEFEKTQERFRSLLAMWGENKKYSRSVVLSKDSYKSVLLAQINKYSTIRKDTPYTIPASFASAKNLQELNKEYNLFKELVKDYYLVEPYSLSHTAKELEDLLELSYMQSKERLFPALKHMNTLARAYQKIDSQIYETSFLQLAQKSASQVRKEKLEEMFQKMTEEKKIFGKGDKGLTLALLSAKEYPSEIAFDLENSFKSLCGSFAKLYTNYLELNLDKIRDNSSEDVLLLAMYKTIVSGVKTLFSEEKADFDRARRQLWISLFENVEKQDASITSKLEFVKENIFPYLHKNLIEIILENAESYQRCQSLLKLVKILETDRTKPLVEIIDPHGMCVGNMKFLENVKDKFLYNLELELKARSKSDTLIVEKISEMKGFIEFSWQALLKEKYPEVFKYRDIKMDLNLVEQLFNKYTAKMKDTKLRSIRTSMATYSQEELPQEIKDAVVFIETLCTVADQLWMAKKIGNLENYQNDSTTAKLKSEMANYSVATTLQMRHAHIALQCGCPVETTEEDLKKCYLKISMALHPDKRHYPIEVPQEVVDYLENKLKNIPNPSKENPK